MLKAFARIARDSVYGGNRSLVFASAIQRLPRDPLAAIDSGNSVLSDLFYDQGNGVWSIEPDFMRSCVEHTSIARALFPDCGLGLSTIVIVVGAVAQQIGNVLWSLKHMPEWAERFQRSLDEYGLHAARVCRVSLVPCDDALDRNAPPQQTMPQQFGLVICDRLPAQTRRGRYGFVPVMRDLLEPGCVVLLDSAEGEAGQDIVRRWAGELSATVRTCGSEKPYFDLVVGDAAGRGDRDMSANH